MLPTYINITRSGEVTDTHTTFFLSDLVRLFMLNLPEMRGVEIDCVDPDGELVTANSVYEKIVDGYCDEEPAVGEEWYVEVVERDGKITKLAPIFKLETNSDYKSLDFDPETDDATDLPEEIKNEVFENPIGEKNNLLNRSEL